MNDINKVFQYLRYVRIDKFDNVKVDKYPDINYKHYIRYPRFWLKRLFKSNSNSKILLNLLRKRRSVRKFGIGNIKFEQLNFILSSSLGVSDLNKYYRTYPSAGALYPVECYLLVQNRIDLLTPGVYHYNFFLNCLELINSEINDNTATSIFGDNAFQNTSVYIILTCIPSRLTWKYRVRGLGFIYIEAGHIGQNIYLTSLAQKVGCVSLGGFIDRKVINLLKIREDYEYPIYALALGLEDKK